MRFATNFLKGPTDPFGRDKDSILSLKAFKGLTGMKVLDQENDSKCKKFVRSVYQST